MMIDVDKGKKYTCVNSEMIDSSRRPLSSLFPFFIVTTRKVVVSDTKGDKKER